MARKLASVESINRQKRIVVRRQELSKEVRDHNRQTRLDKRKFMMVDDEWGLEFVPMNIVVIKKEYTKKGDLKMTRLSFHATIEGAVFKMYKLMFEKSANTESISTVEDLKEEITRLNRKLLHSISAIKQRIDGTA